jgi:hypothetical protein
VPELTKAARDRGISAMFTANTEIALLHAGVEESDPGYSRQLAHLGAPENGSRVNVANVSFPAYRIAATTPIDGWALYDGGELLASGEMEPRWPRAGDVIELVAGKVHVALT